MGLWMKRLCELFSVGARTHRHYHCPLIINGWFHKTFWLCPKTIRAAIFKWQTHPINEASNDASGSPTKKTHIMTPEDTSSIYCVRSHMCASDMWYCKRTIRTLMNHIYIYIYIYIYVWVTTKSRDLQFFGGIASGGPPQGLHMGHHEHHESLCGQRRLTAWRYPAF